MEIGDLEGGYVFLYVYRYAIPDIPSCNYCCNPLGTSSEGMCCSCRLAVFVMFCVQHPVLQIVIQVVWKALL